MEQELQVGIISIDLPQPLHVSRSSSPNSYLEDTESVYSLQDWETDVARDTSDTNTKSDSNSNSFELEYEVNSLSPEDEVLADLIGSSSDSEMMVTHAISNIFQESVDKWVTDHESSDNTFEISITARLTDYRTCAQCNMENDNRRYRYCHSCFQIRKSTFPPRPKPKKRKKTEETKKQTSTTSSDALSKDSGIDSGQNSNLANLIQPQDPQPSTSTMQDPQLSTSSIDLDLQPSTSSGIRYHIPSSSKEPEDPESKRKRIKREEEMCIMCYSSPRDCIFLHGSRGHMVSCYKCAVNTWKTLKCCPICNCKVSNIIKVFNSS